MLAVPNHTAVGQLRQGPSGCTGTLMRGKSLKRATRKPEAGSIRQAQVARCRYLPISLTWSTTRKQKRRWVSFLPIWGMTVYFWVNTVFVKFLVCNRKLYFTYFSHFTNTLSTMAPTSSQHGRISSSAGLPGHEPSDALRHLAHIDICSKSMFSFAQNCRQQKAT